VAGTRSWDLARRAGRAAVALATRNRSKRCSRSASSSWSARTMALSTSSDAAPLQPRGREQACPRIDQAQCLWAATAGLCRIDGGLEGCGCCERLGRPLRPPPPQGRADADEGLAANGLAPGVSPPNLTAAGAAPIRRPDAIASGLLVGQEAAENLILIPDSRGNPHLDVGRTPTAPGPAVLGNPQDVLGRRPNLCSRRAWRVRLPSVGPRGALAGAN
jgi:hypothetical protein